MTLPAASPNPNGKSRPLAVTGKLKTTLDLMVFGPTEGEQEGIAMALPDACRTTGFSFASMRRALERPHVQRYLKTQKQVMRASVSAQNISALVRLRDESGNAMAQLGAIKVLEQLDEDEASSGAARRAPGLQIVVHVKTDAQPVVDITPNRSEPLDVD